MSKSRKTELPLSGDVNQWFRAIWEPWTNWMGQLGFVNINIGATSAPDVEEQIVTQVASYGSQIGRIADALDVLIAQQLADPAQLKVEQIAAFTAFRSQLEEVRRAKRVTRDAKSASLGV